MLQFTVDEARCTKCGLCVKDCPAEIIEREGKAVPHIKAGQEESCLQCQHCLAICPGGAISILGRHPHDSLELSPEVLPTFEQMTRLLRGRRSVRQYRDENVDPALIESLLATVANAPTGVNQRELTFTVIDNKADMQRLREKAYRGLTAATAAHRIPAHFDFLQGAAEFFTGGPDFIFRGAPHLLVVSAPPDAPCPKEDVSLALAYFELLAQSAGLGTVWCGLFKMTLETLPELKPLLDLPADHHYYPMLFGRPAIRYARTVQRDDAATVRRVALPAADRA